MLREERWLQCFRIARQGVKPRTGFVSSSCGVSERRRLQGRLWAVGEVSVEKQYFCGQSTYISWGYEKEPFRPIAACRRGSCHYRLVDALGMCQYGYAGGWPL